MDSKIVATTDKNFGLPALERQTPLGRLHVETSGDTEPFFGFHIVLDDRLLALVEVNMLRPEGDQLRVLVYGPPEERESEPGDYRAFSILPVVTEKEAALSEPVSLDGSTG